jgi:uncharacterized LabA/DUF88 family protein
MSLGCECDRAWEDSLDYVYIDNSNLYIEGRRVSAVAQGLSPNIIDAMNNGILDHAYTISFGKLYEFLCGKDKLQIKRAALFGSRPPPNDGIWKIAKTAGFELHLEDRNYANKEKKIDTGIATLLTKDAYKSDGYRNGRPGEDVFVLVAGDSDYVPTINELKADGFKVEVVFWNHASRELKSVAPKFIGLDSYLELLRL